MNGRMLIAENRHLEWHLLVAKEIERAIRGWKQELKAAAQTPYFSIPWSSRLSRPLCCNVEVLEVRYE